MYRPLLGDQYLLTENFFHEEPFSPFLLLSYCSSGSSPFIPALITLLTIEGSYRGTNQS